VAGRPKKPINENALYRIRESMINSLDGPAGSVECDTANGHVYNSLFLNAGFMSVPL